MSIAIVLKEGAPHDPGWQACVPELCGCATWAPTEDGVLERVPAKIEEHLAWLRSHGDAPPPFDGSVEIVERVRGDEVLLAWDRAEASAAEVRRARQLLQWSRADVIQVVSRLPSQALDWDPPHRPFPEWATWKTVRQILAHIAQTETGYYLRWIGHSPAHRDPAATWRELLQHSRAETSRFLERLEHDADRLRLVEERVEAWSVRKVLRRLVWHERLHFKSIRRIAGDFRRLRDA
ncbi:MAG: DinB family protein [Planctomycetota bacterium]|jgi:predicted RNase H-like HicB family nuclease